MSRGQSTEAFRTAKEQNQSNFNNAQTAFGKAQGAVGDYENNLARFVSGNPYVKGGEFDRTINQGLANTSDAAANSLKGALQSQTLRTGQNSASNAATAASAARQGERDLAGDLAKAQQQRIAGEAGYSQTALQASAVPEEMEAGLYGQASGAANSELNTETEAARTPGFWDTLGQSFASSLGSAPSRVAYGAGGFSVGK